jgi:hypothetical protein
MSTVLAAATAAKIQEIRAQSLATMLSIVGTNAQAGQTGQRPAGTGLPPAETAQIRAILVEMQPNGRAVVQLAGGYAEVDLPPALLRQLAANPANLKPGALVLLPADVPARPVPGPATAVTVPAIPALPPQPQPPGAFPAGSLGAALTRMTGMALPPAEPAPAAATQRGNPNVTTVLRAAPLPAGLPAPVAEAALQAAARHLPLATVLTSLVTRALTPPGDSEPLPPALKAALETLLPLRALPAMLAKPEGLKQALQQSGLFLESQLIRGAPPPEGDLKATLTAVRQTADAARHTRGHEQGSMAEMGRLAEGGTERIKLMQLASLPAPAEWHRSEDNSQGFRLTLSVPLAPQGHERPQTAMMGVMIEHQPQPMPEPEDATARESQGEAQPFPWKVRIALDLEETGPVEAEIGLRGQSVSVQLWAEQPGMAKLARAAIGDLHAALSNAAFEIVKLDVHDGRATPRPALPNPYLDRRT